VFWGSLIELLFMMPLAGAAIGAASGALKDRLADLGINDDFMRQAARTLQSGNAALFLLTRKMTTDKVVAALRGVGGAVMRSSFDETNEEALRAGGAGGCAVGDRSSRRLNSQLAPGILALSKGGLTCCSRAVSLSPTFSPTSCRSLSSWCGSGC
jgi:hypothetical protein